MKPDAQNNFSHNQSDKALNRSPMRNKLQTLRERFGNSIRKGRTVDDAREKQGGTNQHEFAFTELDFAAQYDGSYPYWSNDTNLFYY